MATPSKNAPAGIEAGTFSNERKLIILAPQAMPNAARSAKAARALNTFLHDVAKLDSTRRADPATYEPGDEKLLHDCSQLDATCLIQIGRDKRAAELLYGVVRERGGAYEVELHLFDVEGGVDSKWQGAAPDLRASAKSAYETLTRPVHF